MENRVAPDLQHLVYNINGLQGLIDEVGVIHIVFPLFIDVRT